MKERSPVLVITTMTAEVGHAASRMTASKQSPGRFRSASAASPKASWPIKAGNPDFRAQLGQNGGGVGRAPAG